MTPESREELISAYLDDELAPQERAEVEQMMAAEPALRKLHEELAALRATMQSLPRHKLEHDLGPAVLRRAERLVLRGGTTEGSAEDPSPMVSLRQWWSQGAGWRRLAWPAIAVAAALLIALFETREDKPERQVAQAPQGETAITARPTPAADAVTQEGAPAGGISVAKEKSGARYASPQLAPAEPAGKRVAAPAMNKRAPAIGMAPAAAPAVPTAARPAAPADVVLIVRPDYVQARRFEKLLAQQDMEWTGDADDPYFNRKSRSAEPASEAVDTAQAAAEPAAHEYTIEATSQQLDALLTELRQETGDVKQVVDRRAEREQKTPPADNAKRPYRVVMQALTAPPLPQPAASPADADQP